MDAVQIIEENVGPALLVIMRIGGLAIFAPVISSSMVPARVRIFLVFMIGLGAFGMLSANGVTMAAVPMEPLALLPLAAGEVAVGALIGFMASIPLLAMRTGGLICGQQMGLGFARFYNPAVGEESDVVEQIFYFLGLAGFLMIGGMEATFLSVLYSFEYVHAGIFATGQGVVHVLTGMMMSSLDIGLRVALPLLGVIFLETVAMGFVSKTVPQLNILSLGFPLRIMVGIGVLISGIAIMDQVALDWISDGLEIMHDWATTPQGRAV